MYQIKTSNCLAIFYNIYHFLNKFINLGLNLIDERLRTALEAIVVEQQ